MAENGTQPSMSDSALSWVLENKLRAVFYTWATGVTGSLVSTTFVASPPLLPPRFPRSHRPHLATCTGKTWGGGPRWVCNFALASHCLARPPAAADLRPPRPHASLLLQAYQWSRPTPISLKIIHSRVYAQAITLAALGAVAGMEMYAASTHPEIKPASRHEDY